jgi:dUTP pyrophosphatase
MSSATNYQMNKDSLKIGNLQVKKLHPNAKIPVRSTNHAAAYDLYTPEDGIINPHNKAIVKTGISIRIPQLPPPLRVFGSMRSRSGLSARNSIEVGAGVIDEDFGGDLCVILYNHSGKDFKYSAGDRIAQLILTPYIAPDVVEVDELSELENDNRGTGGFGSTGL